MNNFEGLTLKTSPLTGKSWLVDVHGKRCSEKFKVAKAEKCDDVITLLSTDVGSVIYSKYSSKPCVYPNVAYCYGITKLRDNLYLVLAGGMCTSRWQYLLDEKLNHVAIEYGYFYDSKPLSEKLIGVKANAGWGIIDTTTGKWVKTPCYFELEVRDGKIIGKTKKEIVTECEVNV